MIMAVVPSKFYLQNQVAGRCLTTLNLRDHSKPHGLYHTTHNKIIISLACLFVFIILLIGMDAA